MNASSLDVFIIPCWSTRCLLCLPNRLSNKPAKKGIQISKFDGTKESNDSHLKLVDKTIEILEFKFNHWKWVSCIPSIFYCEDHFHLWAPTEEERKIMTPQKMEQTISFFRNY